VLVLSVRQTVSWCKDRLFDYRHQAFVFNCFRQILQKGGVLKIILFPLRDSPFNNSKRIIFFYAGTFVMATEKCWLRGIFIRICYPVIRMLDLRRQWEMLQQTLIECGNLIALKLFSLLLLDFI
jgi:hypothetical protein